MKARRAYAALLAVGWQLKRRSGSHRTLSRTGYPDFVFAFHDAQRRFFTREAEGAGRWFIENMVVCECFDVAYRPAQT